MEVVKGWLLVYLAGSVPLLAFYSAGLSGWFFDYPKGLFAGIFLLFLVPLFLLVFKVPSAPAWNIALLCGGAGLIVVRTLHAVLLMERALRRPELLTLTTIVAVALVWAIVWTRYFLVSERVAKIFA